MFVVRSAFWLFIGFLLVAPHGTDFGAAATTLKDQAVEASLEAGQQLVVSRIASANRLPDLLVSLSSPLEQLTAAPVVVTVLPRPRPAALS
jgi:hypothetical protein